MTIAGIHQMIVTEIWKSLKDYIRSEKGSCIPMVDPLDCDDKTMIQSDVMVVCDRGIIRRIKRKR